MDNTAFHKHMSERAPETTDILSSDKYLCGYHLFYRLFKKVDNEHIEKYFISAELEGSEEDSVIRELGTDPERAVRAFLTVADNCVTPCTLDEVLQDLDYSELINM